MSSGSGPGSGADQHLLALLRAIRLRQTAPEAAAAGEADAAAALEAEGRRPALTSGEEYQPLPPGAGRPGWATATPTMPGRDFFRRPPAADEDEFGDPDGAFPDDPPRTGGMPDLSGSFGLVPLGDGPATGGYPESAANSGDGSPRRGGAAGIGNAAARAAAARLAIKLGLPATASTAGEVSGPAVADGDPGTVEGSSGSRAQGGNGVPGRPLSGDLVPGWKPAEYAAVEPMTTGRPAPGPATPDSGTTVEAGTTAYPGTSAQAGANAQPEGFARSGRTRRPGLDSHAGLGEETAPGSRGATGGRPATGRSEAGRAGRAPAEPARPGGAPLPLDRGPLVRPLGLQPGDPGALQQAGDGVPGHEGEATAEGAAAGVPNKLRKGPTYIAPPMVVAPARVRSGRDGMDPADDDLLQETQRLLATSLTFAGGSEDVAQRFRAALLQASPHLPAALPGDAESQVERFAQALTWLVHHLDRPPLLVAGCGALGAALAECGIEPGELQFVGAALAEAMRAGMPPGTWRQDFDVAWRSTWQHVYEWIRHGETLPGHQTTVWDAVVVGHEGRRSDLAVVRLRPFLPMPFRPGQYARIEVAGLPGIWRPYSLAGNPRQDDVIEVHVRAKTQTGVSGALVYRTGVGDRVRVSRAEGEMGLPSSSRDLLMIAGDTGVAPLKALLRELAATGDSRSTILFWGVRNLDELYDIAEINEIARTAHKATVVPVISEGDPGPYASGLVTDAVAAYGEWSGHEVYLAGPPLMLAATSAALHQLGVAPERIHHDAPE